MQIQYISAGQSELIQLVSIVSKWKLSEWILFRDINDRIEWGVDIQNQAVYIEELALTKKHLAITKQSKKRILFENANTIPNEHLIWINRI